MLKITRILMAATLLCFSQLALASTCPTSGSPDVSPERFVWTLESDGHYSGVMEIGEATFTIGGETITTRAYRQAGGQYSIPGPTMVMKPGAKYVLSFKNTLPYEDPSAEHNTFKDPNTSNLHTHGLHISGESPSDDVTRSFDGGYGGDFVYDITDDHMRGTYWYHAHHHGSTFLQVSGGAFGLIIIDDDDSPEAGVPENVAAMVEQHMVFGFLDPAVAGTGGDTLISGTLSPTWTFNGKTSGDVCMPVNTWQHWRTLIADRDAREKTITVGANCEVALMARDGVWRTTVPKPLPTNSVTMTGASRADLAVRCSGDSTISIAGQVVANVFADNSLPASDAHPYAADGTSTWDSIRPDYLRDLRGETPGNFETVSMGARTINGSKFDANVPTFTLPADSLQEWTVKGATQHPFHLHIYHMQMLTDCSEYEGGEYYDVIATNCKVRFDLDPDTAEVYDGRTIMHCHILAHEDQGAMGWMDVVGGLAAPTFPNGFQYSEHYPLGDPGDPPPAAPTSLSASAVSSSQINLSWADNSADESGFDIQRSTDGSTFATLTSVSADTTSYSDSNLTAATTYWYQVAAFNGNGSSAASNTASATTQGGGGGTEQITVDSITVTTVNAGRGAKAGQAVIVISDGLGNLLQGATVTGNFTGTLSDSGLSGTTDNSGSVTFSTSGTAKGGISLTFCTTSVTHSSLDNFTGEVCGSL
jgi:FtsP/CotA-like multicopper oxidase with cupredoxin domain